MILCGCDYSTKYRDVLDRESGSGGESSVWAITMVERVSGVVVSPSQSPGQLQSYFGFMYDYRHRSRIASASGGMRSERGEEEYPGTKLASGLKVVLLDVPLQWLARRRFRSGPKDPDYPAPRE